MTTSFTNLLPSSASLLPQAAQSMSAPNIYTNNLLYRRIHRICIFYFASMPKQPQHEHPSERPKQRQHERHDHAYNYLQWQANADIVEERIVASLHDQGIRRR